MWVYLSFGLTGVVGLLFGLWQLSRAKNAIEKADSISKELAQVGVDRKAEKASYEAFILTLKGEIYSLKNALDKGLKTPADVSGRLNDLLSWRVSTPPANPTAKLSLVTSSTDGESVG